LNPVERTLNLGKISHDIWDTSTDKTQPLDNRTISRLETAIKNSQYVSAGQSLKVVPKVNPEIRGGLIVEIADRTIDLSVSAKMAKMNKLLKDTL
jgi:F-type H+-transporting ATPase subunit O